MFGLGLNKNLSDKQRQRFFSQLYVLLHAGLSFSAAFCLIIEGTKEGEREICERLLKQVVSGDALWAALRDSRCFSRLDCNVIRAGEESGRLLEVLMFLSEYYEKRDAHRKAIVSALSYPMITLAVTVVVIVFMLIVIVPMFEQVYIRMGGELPALTKLLINFSAVMPFIIAVLLGIVAAFFVARHFYRESCWWQERESRVLLGIPAVGGLLKNIELTKFCRIMCLLVESDISLLRSLNLVGDVMLLHSYRKAIRQACFEIENGVMMWETLARESCLYGKKFIAMLRVGEETGALGHMLRTLADDMSTETDYRIKQINNLLEPIMILIVGAIVAFVLIAMYLPMFRLGMTIQ